MRSKIELAAMLEVDHRKLTQWLGHAELPTVKKIDARAADLLCECGIDGLTALAGAEAAELTRQYNQIVEARGHDVLKPVTPAMVQAWIDAARAYAGLREDAAIGSDKKS